MFLLLPFLAAFYFQTSTAQNRAPETSYYTTTPFQGTHRSVVYTINYAMFTLYNPCFNSGGPYRMSVHAPAGGGLCQAQTDSQVHEDLDAPAPATNYYVYADITGPFQGGTTGYCSASIPATSSATFSIRYNSYQPGQQVDDWRDTLGFKCESASITIQDSIAPLLATQLVCDYGPCSDQHCPYYANQGCTACADRRNSTSFPDCDLCLNQFASASGGAACYVDSVPPTCTIENMDVIKSEITVTVNANDPSPSTGIQYAALFFDNVRMAYWAYAWNAKHAVEEDEMSTTLSDNLACHSLQVQYMAVDWAGNKKTVTTPIIVNTMAPAIQSVTSLVWKIPMPVSFIVNFTCCPCSSLGTMVTPSVLYNQQFSPDSNHSYWKVNYTLREVFTQSCLPISVCVSDRSGLCGTLSWCPTIKLTPPTVKCTIDHTSTSNVMYVSNLTNPLKVRCNAVFVSDPWLAPTAVVITTSGDARLTCRATANSQPTTPEFECTNAGSNSASTSVMSVVVVVTDQANLTGSTALNLTVVRVPPTVVLRDKTNALGTTVWSREPTRNLTAEIMAASNIPCCDVTATISNPSHARIVSFNKSSHNNETLHYLVGIDDLQCATFSLQLCYKNLQSCNTTQIELCRESNPPTCDFSGTDTETHMPQASLRYVCWDNGGSVGNITMTLYYNNQNVSAQALASSFGTVTFPTVPLGQYVVDLNVCNHVGCASFKTNITRFPDEETLTLCPSAKPSKTCVRLCLAANHSNVGFVCQCGVTNVLDCVQDEDVSLKPYVLGTNDYCHSRSVQCSCPAGVVSVFTQTKFSNNTCKITSHVTGVNLVQNMAPPACQMVPTYNNQWRSPTSYVLWPPVPQASFYFVDLDLYTRLETNATYYKWADFQQSVGAPTPARVCVRASSNNSMLISSPCCVNVSAFKIDGSIPTVTISPMRLWYKSGNPLCTTVSAEDSQSGLKSVNVTLRNVVGTRVFDLVEGAQPGQFCVTPVGNGVELRVCVVARDNVDNKAELCTSRFMLSETEPVMGSTDMSQQTYTYAGVLNATGATASNTLLWNEARSDGFWDVCVHKDDALFCSDVDPIPADDIVLVYYSTNQVVIVLEHVILLFNVSEEGYPSASPTILTAPDQYYLLRFEKQDIAVVGDGSPNPPAILWTPRNQHAKFLWLRGRLVQYNKTWFSTLNLAAQSTQDQLILCDNNKVDHPQDMHCACASSIDGTILQQDTYTNISTNAQAVFLVSMKPHYHNAILVQYTAGQYSLTTVQCGSSSMFDDMTTVSAPTSQVFTPPVISVYRAGTVMRLGTFTSQLDEVDLSCWAQIDTHLPGYLTVNVTCPNSYSLHVAIGCSSCECSHQITIVSGVQVGISPGPFTVCLNGYPIALGDAQSNNTTPTDVSVPLAPLIVPWVGAWIDLGSLGRVYVTPHTNAYDVSFTFEGTNYTRTVLPASQGITKTLSCVLTPSQVIEWGNTVTGINVTYLTDVFGQQLIAFNDTSASFAWNDFGGNCSLSLHITNPRITYNHDFGDVQVIVDSRNLVVTVLCVKSNNMCTISDIMTAANVVPGLNAVVARAFSVVDSIMNVSVYHDSIITAFVQSTSLTRIFIADPTIFPDAIYVNVSATSGKLQVIYVVVGGVTITSPGQLVAQGKMALQDALNIAKMAYTSALGKVNQMVNNVRYIIKQMLAFSFNVTFGALTCQVDVKYENSTVFAAAACQLTNGLNAAFAITFDTVNDVWTFEAGCTITVDLFGGVLQSGITAIKQIYSSLLQKVNNLIDDAERWVTTQIFQPLRFEQLSITLNPGSLIPSRVALKILVDSIHLQGLAQFLSVDASIGATCELIMSPWASVSAECACPGSIDLTLQVTSKKLSAQALLQKASVVSGVSNSLITNALASYPANTSFLLNFTLGLQTVALEELQIVVPMGQCLTFFPVKSIQFSCFLSYTLETQAALIQITAEDKSLGLAVEGTAVLPDIQSSTIRIYSKLLDCTFADALNFVVELFGLDLKNIPFQEILKAVKFVESLYIPDKVSILLSSEQFPLFGIATAQVSGQLDVFTPANQNTDDDWEVTLNMTANVGGALELDVLVSTDASVPTNVRLEVLDLARGIELICHLFHIDLSIFPRALNFVQNLLHVAMHFADEGTKILKHLSSLIPSEVSLHINLPLLGLGNAKCYVSYNLDTELWKLGGELDLSQKYGIDAKLSYDANSGLQVAFECHDCITRILDNFPAFRILDKITQIINVAEIVFLFVDGELQFSQNAVLLLGSFGVNTPLASASLSGISLTLSTGTLEAVATLTVAKLFSASVWLKLPVVSDTGSDFIFHSYLLTPIPPFTQSLQCNLLKEVAPIVVYTEDGKCPVYQLSVLKQLILLVKPQIAVLSTTVQLRTEIVLELSGVLAMIAQIFLDSGVNIIGELNTFICERVGSVHFPPGYCAATAQVASALKMGFLFDFTTEEVTIEPKMMASTVVMGLSLNKIGSGRYFGMFPYTHIDCQLYVYDPLIPLLAVLDNEIYPFLSSRWGYIQLTVSNAYVFLIGSVPIVFAENLMVTARSLFGLGLEAYISDPLPQLNLMSILSGGPITVLHFALGMKLYFPEIIVKLFGLPEAGVGFQKSIDVPVGSACVKFISNPKKFYLLVECIPKIFRDIDFGIGNVGILAGDELGDHKDYDIQAGVSLNLKVLDVSIYARIKSEDVQSASVTSSVNVDLEIIKLNAFLEVEVDRVKLQAGLVGTLKITGLFVAINAALTAAVSAQGVQLRILTEAQFLFVNSHIDFSMNLLSGSLVGARLGMTLGVGGFFYASCQAALPVPYIDCSARLWGNSLTLRLGSGQLLGSVNFRMSLLGMFSAGISADVMISSTAASASVTVEISVKCLINFKATLTVNLDSNTLSIEGLRHVLEAHIRVSTDIEKCLQQLIQKIAHIVKDAIRDLANVIADIVHKIEAMVAQIIATIQKAISDAIQQAVNAVKHLWDSISHWFRLRNHHSFHALDADSLAQLLQSLGYAPTCQGMYDMHMYAYVEGVVTQEFIESCHVTKDQLQQMSDNNMHVGNMDDARSVFRILVCQKGAPIIMCETEQGVTACSDCMIPDLKGYNLEDALSYMYNMNISTDMVFTALYTTDIIDVVTNHTDKYDAYADAFGEDNLLGACDRAGGANVLALVGFPYVYSSAKRRGNTNPLAIFEYGASLLHMQNLTNERYDQWVLFLLDSMNMPATIEFCETACKRPGCLTCLQLTVVIPGTLTESSYIQLEFPDDTYLFNGARNVNDTTSAEMSSKVINLVPVRSSGTIILTLADIVYNPPAYDALITITVRLMNQYFNKTQLSAIGVPYPQLDAQTELPPGFLITLDYYVYASQLVITLKHENIILRPGTVVTLDFSADHTTAANCSTTCDAPTPRSIRFTIPTLVQDATMLTANFEFGSMAVTASGDILHDDMIMVGGLLGQFSASNVLTLANVTGLTIMRASSLPHALTTCTTQISISNPLPEDAVLILNLCKTVTCEKSESFARVLLPESMTTAKTVTNCHNSGGGKELMFQITLCPATYGNDTNVCIVLCNGCPYNGTNIAVSTGMLTIGIQPPVIMNPSSISVSYTLDIPAVFPSVLYIDNAPICNVDPKSVPLFVQPTYTATGCIVRFLVDVAAGAVEGSFTFTASIQNSLSIYNAVVYDTNNDLTHHVSIGTITAIEPMTIRLNVTETSKVADVSRYCSVSVFEAGMNTTSGIPRGGMMKLCVDPKQMYVPLTPNTPFQIQANGNGTLLCLLLKPTCDAVNSWCSPTVLTPCMVPLVMGMMPIVSCNVFSPTGANVAAMTNAGTPQTFVNYGSCARSVNASVKQDEVVVMIVPHNQNQSTTNATLVLEDGSMIPSTSQPQSNVFRFFDNRLRNLTFVVVQLMTKEQKICNVPVLVVSLPQQFRSSLHRYHEMSSTIPEGIPTAKCVGVYQQVTCQFHNNNIGYTTFDLSETALNPKVSSLPLGCLYNATEYRVITCTSSLSTLTFNASVLQDLPKANVVFMNQATSQTVPLNLTIILPPSATSLTIDLSSNLTSNGAITLTLHTECPDSAIITLRNLNRNASVCIAGCLVHAHTFTPTNNGTFCSTTAKLFDECQADGWQLDFIGYDMFGRQTMQAKNLTIPNIQCSWNMSVAAQLSSNVILTPNVLLNYTVRLTGSPLSDGTWYAAVTIPSALAYHAEEANSGNMSNILSHNPLVITVPCESSTLTCSGTLRLKTLFVRGAVGNWTVSLYSPSNQLKAQVIVTNTSSPKFEFSGGVVGSVTVEAMSCNWVQCYGDAQITLNTPASTTATELVFPKKAILSCVMKRVQLTSAAARNPEDAKVTLASPSTVSIEVLRETSSIPVSLMVTGPNLPLYNDSLVCSTSLPSTAAKNANAIMDVVKLPWFFDDICIQSVTAATKTIYTGTMTTLIVHAQFLQVLTNSTTPVLSLDLSSCGIQNVTWQTFSSELYIANVRTPPMPLNCTVYPSVFLDSRRLRACDNSIITLSYSVVAVYKYTAAVTELFQKNSLVASLKLDLATQRQSSGFVASLLLSIPTFAYYFYDEKVVVCTATYNNVSTTSCVNATLSVVQPSERILVFPLQTTASRVTVWVHNLLLSEYTSQHQSGGGIIRNYSTTICNGVNSTCVKRLVNNVQTVWQNQTQEGPVVTNNADEGCIVGETAVKVHVAAYAQPYEFVSRGSCYLCGGNRSNDKNATKNSKSLFVPAGQMVDVQLCMDRSGDCAVTADSTVLHICTASPGNLTLSATLGSDSSTLNVTVCKERSSASALSTPRKDALPYAAVLGLPPYMRALNVSAPMYAKQTSSSSSPSYQLTILFNQSDPLAMNATCWTWLIPTASSIPGRQLPWQYFNILSLSSVIGKVTALQFLDAGTYYPSGDATRGPCNSTKAGNLSVIDNFDGSCEAIWGTNETLLVTGNVLVDTSKQTVSNLILYSTSHVTSLNLLVLQQARLYAGTAVSGLLSTNHTTVTCDSDSFKATLRQSHLIGDIDVRPSCVLEVDNTTIQDADFGTSLLLMVSGPNVILDNVRGKQLTLLSSNKHTTSSCRITLIGDCAIDSILNVGQCEVIIPPLTPPAPSLSDDGSFGAGIVAAIVICVLLVVVGAVLAARHLHRLRNRSSYEDILEGLTSQEDNVHTFPPYQEDETIGGALDDSYKNNHSEVLFRSKIN